MKRTVFLVSGLCALAAGCAQAPTSAFDVLDAASEPLRSRFNASKGKVRVLMLVSPT